MVEGASVIPMSQVCASTMSIQVRVVDQNVQRCYGCECSNVHNIFC